MQLDHRSTVCMMCPEFDDVHTVPIRACRMSVVYTHALLIMVLQLFCQCNPHAVFRILTHVMPCVCTVQIPANRQLLAELPDVLLHRITALLATPAYGDLALTQTAGVCTCISGFRKCM